MASTAPRRMPKHLKATYLADQEYLLEETRATGLFYFPGPIVWLLVFGVLTYVTEASRDHWWGSIAAYATELSKIGTTAGRAIAVLFGFLFLVGLVWLLVRYLRWIRTVYAVTSRRVIVQKGILGRDFDEIPVNQVRGVDVHQSVGQRILGYGSVRVSSEGMTRLGNEDWLGIPKPFRFQKLIENAAQGTQTPPPPR
jgi:membrane protein YdbS with pleckstrin-like domain